MALDIKQGSFQLQTSGSTQYVDTGFQPKALMFWWGGGNTDGGATNERGMIGFCGMGIPGFGTTYNQGAHAWMTRHNQSPTQAASVFSQLAAILALNTDANSPSVRAEARVDALQSTDTFKGFRLNIVQRDTNAMEVFYLALGGSDIEHADVVTAQAPAVTGNVDYQTKHSSTIATFFQPDIILSAGSQATSSTPSGTTDAGPMFGAARSSTERRVSAARNVDASVSSNAQHTIRNNRIVYEIGQSEADLVQMNADGFRLNWTAIGGTRRWSSFLAIKGARWKIGDTATTPAAVGDSATTGVGLAPNAAIIAGPGLSTAIGSLGNPYSFALGAHGGSTAAAMSGTVQNAAGSPASARGQMKDKSVYRVSQTAVVQDSAAVTSFDPDGFTLEYTATAGAGGRYWYVALASNQTVTGVTDVSGIATAEAFGVGEIKSAVAGEGIASDEAFGLGSITGPVGSGAAGGIATAEDFGVGAILGGLRPTPPTAEPLWRMIYTDMDGNVIGEIEDASQRRFSFLLNRPRVATFKLDLRNRMFKEILARKNGHILLYRDRQLKMTTEILSAEVARGSDNEKALAVSALETMWQRLPFRLIGKSTTGFEQATALSRATMLSNLLTILNNEDDTGIRFQSGTDVTSTLIGGPWRYKPYMELVQELSASANGFDFQQIPANPLGTGITGYLELKNIIGTTRSEAIFEYGNDGKSNVKDYRWVVDRSQMINRGYALPADFPDNVLLEVASASDATQITAEGLREAVISEDLKDYDLRVQLATEHVAVRKLPMERFFFTPATNNDLEPFVDYDVGDTVVGRVKDQGVLALNAAVRCYGITVEPNDEGTENVNLTLVDEP